MGMGSTAWSRELLRKFGLPRGGVPSQLSSYTIVSRGERPNATSNSMVEPLTLPSLIQPGFSALSSRKRQSPFTTRQPAPEAAVAAAAAAAEAPSALRPTSPCARTAESSDEESTWAVLDWATFAWAALAWLVA